MFQFAQKCTHRESNSFEETRDPEESSKAAAEKTSVVIL